MNKHYSLGIIPCTKTKRADGKTARTLYAGGPFSLFMRHALQRCDVVMIMSARYGLLELNASVRYYDATMGTLTSVERQELIRKLRMQMPWLVGRRTLAYVPKVYYEVALEACPGIAASWHRPYKTLPMLPLWALLKREIEDHEQRESAASSGLQLPVLPRRGFSSDFDEG